MHALLRRVGPLVLALAVASCDEPAAAGEGSYDARVGEDATEPAALRSVEVASDGDSLDAPQGAAAADDSVARSAVAMGEDPIATDPIAADPIAADPVAADPIAESIGAGPMVTEPIEDGEPEQPGGFHFVLTHDRTYVVLRARTEEAWGTGPLALAAREGPMVIVRDVSSAALPQDVMEAASQRMVLRRGRDVVCVAELGAPQLLRRAYPHWEQSQIWNGEQEAPRASDAQVAQEGWEIASDSELLVAEAVAVSGSCEQAGWAHPEQAPPDVGASAPIARSRILRAFRRLDWHRELQSAWADAREYDDDPGAAQWDARRDADRTIATFRSRDGRRFALVSALAHDGCGEFTGGLWALFEQTSRGLDLVVSEPALTSPRALADVDGDGAPEVIFGDAIVRSDGASVVVTTPYFDCPC